MSSSNSSPTWASLLRIGLLGTNGGKVDSVLEEFWESCEIEEEELEHQLLHSAAIQHLWHKTNFLQKAVMQSEQVAPLETGTPASFKSIQYLNAILGGQFSEALPEFIQLATTHQRIIPPQFLPKLIEQGYADAALWEQLQPVMGERGNWLIQQHPKWQKLYHPTFSSSSNWRNASYAERISLFENRRKDVPQKALDELILLWPNLEAKEKAKLLKAFSFHLSPTDEPFLERCLQEKRKEIRLGAAQHLFNLPTSALIKRLFEAAHSCIALTKNGFEITLPDELPDATKKDGIYPTGSKVKGGLRLNWFLQISEIVPFHFWEVHFDLSAEQLLTHWGNSEYAEVIIPALAQTLVRHPKQEAADAFCRFLFEHSDKNYWEKEACKTLLMNMPANLFNRLLIRWLEAFGPLIPENSLPNYVLQYSNHTWEAALSKIVIKGFQSWIEESGSQHWHIYHYKQLLKKAAYQADPLLFTTIRNGFSFQFNKLGSWAANIEELLQVLNFRKEMKASLIEKPKVL